MSDTLALLALMNKGGSGEGLTEEQVNQVIDNKNLQPKLTAGENITISENNVISATDTGLTQEQVNTLIDSKNLSFLHDLSYIENIIFLYQCQYFLHIKIIFTSHFFYSSVHVLFVFHLNSILVFCVKNSFYRKIYIPYYK